MTPFNLTNQFLRSASELQKEQANKTFKALLLFSANPRHPGLNFEKLSGRAAALSSIRVDQAYRIVLQVTSTATFFHYVGPHDVAYRVAEGIPAIIVARLGTGRSA